MKRKVVSLFLAAALAVSMLAGCGGGGGNDSNGGGSAGGGDTNAEGGSGEGVSSEIDMNEEPYTVAIQIVTLPGTDFSAFEAQMEEKANAITVPAINAKLDIQFVWISEVANTTSMAVAGGEKIDLVHVATVNPLSSLVGSDLLYDMNEGNLLQTRGPKLVEIFGDLLKTGEVNVGGQMKQLAVPANRYNAVARGMYYNKTAADAAGVTVPEKGTLDDLETALYALHEANPDIMCWFVGGGEMCYLYWLTGYEGFGNECSYGAVLDSSAEKPVVENLYASDLFKDYCLRMYKWRQDGIIQKDSTDTEQAQTYIQAQSLFTTPSTANQYQYAMYGAQAAGSGFEVGWMLTTDYLITNASATEYMWGIASSSERPDKAMDMLNLIYSNGELATLLKYGLEGENYTFAAGSDKVIETNGSYNAMFYQAGDPKEMVIQSPAGEDYIELTEKDEAGASTAALINYMFDDSEFQAESSAIYSKITEYLPRLQNGMCESEEATEALIAEFVSALEAAGINDVIAANQAQIDAYLAQ